MNHQNPTQAQTNNRPRAGSSRRKSVAAIFLAATMLVGVLPMNVVEPASACAAYLIPPPLDSVLVCGWGPGGGIGGGGGPPGGGGGGTAPQAQSQPDSDGDGMGDDWESKYGSTLSALSDLDGDGLTNIKEFYWLSNPLVADTDGDGWNDGTEAAYWDDSNEGGAMNDGTSDYAYPGSGAFLDTDGDNIPNIWDQDSDNDGLLDSDELHRGAKPEARDTDGDGLIDGGYMPGLVGSSEVFRDGFEEGFWEKTSNRDDVPLYQNWPIRMGVIQDDGLCWMTGSKWNALIFGDTGTLVPEDSIGRYATTRPLNVLNGGDIQFMIRHGTNTGFPCDKPESTDDLRLEYSLTGATWTSIRTYQAGSHGSWSTVTETIPAAAKSPGTMFRWRELDFEADPDLDIWAIDEVVIRSHGTPNPTGEEEYIIGEVHDVGSLPGRADSDADGLADKDEYDYWTNNRGFPGTKTLDSDGDGIINILDPDSDGDGARDGIEVNAQLEPLDPDTDNDGLPDGWELDYNQNPHVNDASLDTDADAATNRQEYCYGISLSACLSWNYALQQDYHRGGTFPNDADTEDDLVLDGEEMSAGTNPHFWDTDNDGMPDEFEIQYGLNPLNAADASQDADQDFFDQDLDGVPEQVHSNLAEYRYGRDPGYNEVTQGPWQLGTKPVDRDTDSDGMNDAQEVYFGTDARLPTSLDSDEDQDGLNWTSEANRGTDPNDADTDNDGLCDGGRGLACTFPGLPGVGHPGEQDYNSRAWNTDTDGDGLSDGTEASIWDPQASGEDRDIDADLLGGVIDADNDGDDLIDSQEGRTASPFMDVPDSDGDGLLDGAEVNNHLTNPSNPDSDGDGLTDGEEVLQFETKPLVADSDGDGLLDGAEVHEHGTDPLNGDTDSDTLPDSWEVQEGTQPMVADADMDPDGDGLSNVAEYEYGSSPTRLDTDGDTLPDGWEHQYNLDPRAASQNQDPDFDGSLNGAEFKAGTNPRDSDSDDDGLTDGAEATHGTLPTVSDSDADGLRDGAEVNVHGTKPLERDTDRDGLSDFDEVFSSLTDPLDADTDDDGLSDYDEVFRYGGRYDPHDPDTDNDGQSDGEEVASLSDPNADTDGDGIRNGQETSTYGTDPAEPDSDCDGIEDGAEVTFWSPRYGLSTFKPYLRNADVDGDGIKDGIEIGSIGTPQQALYRTAPDMVDTDGDGLDDDEEARNNIRVSCGQGQTSSSTRLPEPVPGQSLERALRDSTSLVQGALYAAPNGVVFGMDDEGVYIQGGYGVRLYPLDVPLDVPDLSSLMGPWTAPMAAGTNGKLTDPQLQDSDGDGLTDGEEIHTYQTDPLLCDTDGDGLGDGLERGKTAYIAPRQGGVCDQRDKDPSTKTSAKSVDTDGDGLRDGPTVSINGRSIQGEDANADGRVDLNGLEGDPLSTDSDGDGLPDKMEFDVLGTVQCVTNPDCDGDTLIDGLEVDWNLDSDVDGRLNFVDADADNDGVPDGLEGAFLSSTAYGWDSDGDGVKNMLDPDADDDGFLDGIEDRHPHGILGSLDLNPLDSDVDGDGIIDGKDLHPLSALAMLSLDLNKLVVDDPVDCGCFTTWNIANGDYIAEAYVSKLWITSDRAGADVIFELNNENLENLGLMGVGRANYQEGRTIPDFTPQIAINVPQDVSLFTPEFSARDVKLYLWMNVHDKDVSEDDQLDVGNRATPTWGDGGKSYFREVSLRKDLYKNWGEITDINGDDDAGRQFDEDDVIISAKFLEEVPMELISQLVKHSTLV